MAMPPGLNTTQSPHIASPLMRQGPERDFVAYGRYVDRMERRDGEWRFARRTMLLDFTRTDPVPASEPGFGTRGGARDRSDLSYTLRLKTGERQ
jgi:hypothetical protein